MNPETTPERGKGNLDGKKNEAEADVSERWQRTAVAAFYLAEARGFSPGQELDDWLAAERELDALASNAESGQRLPPEPGPPQPKEAKASARKRAASKAAARSRGLSRTVSTDIGGRA